jgi:hypothetical protein
VLASSATSIANATIRKTFGETRFLDILILLKGETCFQTEEKGQATSSYAYQLA